MQYNIMTFKYKVIIRLRVTAEVRTNGRSICAEGNLIFKMLPYVMYEKITV